MKQILLVVLFCAVTIIDAYDPPLPYFAPPASNQTEKSTNIALELYGGDEEKMKRRVTKSLSAFDENEDGVISAKELILALNSSFNESENADMNGLPDFQQAVAAADLDKSGNISIAELANVYSSAFLTNFTLLPSICLDTADRINLCGLDMEQNVTDTFLGGATISAKAFFMREQLKCQSGLSGMETDFAFQRCVVGNPCNRVINECFGRRFEGDTVALDIVAATSTNMVIDKSIKDLTSLPFKDPTFQSYLYAGNGDMKAKEIAVGASKVGFWTVFMALFGQMVLEIVKKQVLPLIKAGTEKAVASLLASLTGIAPWLWTVVGGAIAVAVLGYMAVKNLVALLMSIRGGRRDLIMESFDPYAGELELKCEWATYTEQKCWSGGEMAKLKVQSDVCDRGGQLYRERPCSLKNLKEFYQTNCFMGCRHLCLKTNFDCGSDGYSYMNQTEFVYSKPTSSLNPYMFNPAFNGKQYVLVDSRYVYHMTECRDTCDKFTGSLSGSGISKCKGFVLRAPDPLLDPRQAYRRRQVCMLISESEDANLAQERIASSIESKEREYPVFLESINELFEYEVMKSNDYPPLIVGFQN